MIGGQPEDAVELALADARRDARLQASRRLDWRFLLPDPALDRVLYMGPRRGSLAEALEKLSGSLTYAGDHLAGIAPDAFDVVVTCDPSIDHLRRAVPALRTGGALYVEIDRRRVGRRTARGADSRAVRAELDRLGLTTTSIAWHWPDFDACTRIVPLDRPEAFAAALQFGRRGALVRALARAFLAAGLFERFLPSLSIVAQR